MDDDELSIPTLTEVIQPGPKSATAAPPPPPPPLPPELRQQIQEVLQREFQVLLVQSLRRLQKDWEERLPELLDRVAAEATQRRSAPTTPPRKPDHADA